VPYVKVRAMKSAPSLQLQLTNVSFSYRALPVLQNISWLWRRGEQWGCLGPNGAGKTTLAKILSGQLSCASGEIEYNPELQNQGIAYVCFEQQQTLCNRDRQLDDSEFRSDASDPGTTVEQVIRATAADDSQLEHWLQRLGLTHVLDRGIRFISTGEMRKTLLLRAILARPALLILDSPLDGLDRASQGEMSDILEHLLSSDLNLLLLCRQVQDLPMGVSHLLMLSQGQLIACGERDKVLGHAAVQSILNPPVTALGPLPSAASRPYQIPAGQPLLKLVDIAVSYGDVAVLKNVNWVFERGQHCSISGPNGCGKTTLLSLINGDNHKAYGQDITLFGLRRGSGESVWDIKQKFGLLNTQLHLNHVRGMRVLEVVVSGFFDTVGLYDDWGDQQRQIAADWLLALGLDSLGREPFDTLSFGLQRMVLLARAMVKSPVILILDEPCLGLDGHHTQIILRAIDHIAEHTDTQILFVSHCASEMPACINQRLEFVADHDSYSLVCTQA
jgi:molybdate transport system ATP-binding protein